MKNTFNIIWVIIGTLIGAGFASGQEINLFIYSYGKIGFIGLLISSILLCLIIQYSLKIIKEKQINTYKEFLENILKSKNESSFFNIKNIVNIIINIFILITFFIMVAGFGSYFQQEFRIEGYIGSSILAIICFFVFLKSISGFIKLNDILVPILVIFLLLIGFLNIKQINILEITSNLEQVSKPGGIISGILYASYNSVLLIPTLITLRNYLKGEKQIKFISILTTLIIIVLSLIIISLLYRVDININDIEMPVVYVVSQNFKKLKILYGIIILLSILTTSLSLGISFLQNTVKSKKSYPQIATIMCITSVVISKLGFLNLVNLLYPIFGFLGLIQIFKLVAFLNGYSKIRMKKIKSDWRILFEKLWNTNRRKKNK